MTPTQLKKALIRLYGPGSNYHLSNSLAEDMGVVPRTVAYWLDGERTVPPYMQLILEALETRKAAGH